MVVAVFTLPLALSVGGALLGVLAAAFGFVLVVIVCGILLALIQAVLPQPDTGAEEAHRDEPRASQDDEPMSAPVAPDQGMNRPT